MEEEHDDDDDVAVWDVDIGLLIKLVQNFPHIYDHSHKNFKDVMLRRNTWKRIATTIKIPIDDCIRVWKNIRDKYTRERKIAISQPANQQYLSKWDFYDAMEFLSPFIRSRRSLRKSKGFCKKQQEPNDSSDHFSPSSNSKLWDPISVKLSPESMSLLEEEFDDTTQEIEDVTTFESNVVNSTSTRVKEIAQPSTISIVRHQTSEEAFGAYIATRLMEFPPEIRQIKKAKLFKDLEEPEEVFSDYVK